MSINQALLSVYDWLVAQRIAIFIAALAVPIVGTIAARIGKGGKTDADGKFIASTVVAISLSAFIFEIVAAYVAHRVMQKSLLQADFLLVIAPMLGVALTLIGIRWVFPLNDLASVKTFTDLGLFVGACLGVLWVFSKFRGWGILFWGSIPELIAIGVFAIWLLRRLYKRAFSKSDADPASA